MDCGSEQRRSCSDGQNADGFDQVDTGHAGHRALAESQAIARTRDRVDQTLQPCEAGQDPCHPHERWDGSIIRMRGHLDAGFLPQE